jgi:hypothetical protein
MYTKIFDASNLYYTKYKPGQGFQLLKQGSSFKILEVKSEYKF